MIKFLLWMLIITIFGGGFLAAIYGVGSLITYFNTGADPAAALNIQPNVPLDWPVNVEWLPDDADTGREMEPFTRENIESAYIRAWLQQGFSYTKGEPHGLKTYFTGPALAMVEDNVNHVSDQELALQQVATDHLLQLHFYAADGTIAVFTDRQARIAQHIKDGDGQEVMAEEDLAAYQVVMMVDEGNWKVRHWLRRDLQDYGAERPIDETLEPPAEELVRVENGQLMLGDEPYEIRGFNYYPQDHTWTEMWSEYEGDATSDDMALISAMGMNTIRIFVPYELFGVDEVINTSPNHLQQLRDILNEAWRHDLRVIVTLYDFKSDYNLLTWPKADRHLEEILTTFNRHPAILAWDIKNEPDLDYDAAGEELVNIWLKHAVDQARIYDPHHLITIGWAHAENADELASMVDFVSFHFYAPTNEFVDTVTELKIKVGADKPVMLGEFGLPTWNSYFFPHGHTEEEQYNYLRELLLLLEDGSTAGYLAWTVYDFTDIPAQVAGRLPWKRNPQKHMGIIRPDGTQKPAADLFKQPISQELLETPIEEPGGLKPFYQTVLIGLFIFMAAGVYAVWRVYLYIVDRFGHEVEVEAKNGDSATADANPAQAIEPKHTIPQKLWRTWRARRLLKWRQRRDKKYARWDRRKARRQRRWARRKAWWLKGTNVIRVIFGRPVKVDDTIETHLKSGRGATSSTSNTSSDQGSETMDNNEFKPLIEIPEGVKEIQKKLQDDNESLISGESDAQLGEKRLKTKEELIRELLAPVETASNNKEEVAPVESAEEEAPIVAEKASTPPSSDAETVVSMKVPSAEEIAEIKAAIEAEKVEQEEPSHQSNDQVEPESVTDEQSDQKWVKPTLTEITIETATPDTTEIYDIGIPEFDPADSPVQLVYEMSKDGFQTLKTESDESEEAAQPPVAPLNTTDVYPTVPILSDEDLEEMLDGADYSSGNPVIHIDLSEKPADWIGDSEPHQPKPAGEKASEGKPGDGYTIESTAIPSSENEFAQDNETIWPTLSAKPIEAEFDADPVEPDEAPEPVAVGAGHPEVENEDGLQSVQAPSLAEQNKVVVEAQDIPAETKDMKESEVASNKAQNLDDIYEPEVVEEDSESALENNEDSPTAEEENTVEQDMSGEEIMEPTKENQPEPLQNDPEPAEEAAPEPESVEPEVEEEQQGGLTAEEIDRFFTWED